LWFLVYPKQYPQILSAVCPWQLWIFREMKWHLVTPQVCNGAFMCSYRYRWQRQKELENPSEGPKRQPPVPSSRHIKIIVCQRIHYPWQPAILAKDIKNAISGPKKIKGKTKMKGKCVAHRNCNSCAFANWFQRGTRTTPSCNSI